MADDIKCTITGLDAFLRELQSLPQVLQTRLMKGATATACSVIRQEAIRQAPEYTGEVGEGHPPPGTLKKAIYQARVSVKCTKTREVWVIGVKQGRGARATKRGKRSVNLDAYYASWVEFGHYARQANGLSKGKRKNAQKAGAVRWIPARPYMRPAFETKKAEAQRAFWQYLQDRLPDAVRGMSFIKFRR